MGARTGSSALLHRNANTTAEPPPASVFCSQPSGSASASLSACRQRLCDARETSDSHAAIHLGVVTCKRRDCSGHSREAACRCRCCIACLIERNGCAATRSMPRRKTRRRQPPHLTAGRT